MARKIKIATLGAATFDVFLIGQALNAKRDVRTHDYVEQFPLGAKIELDGVVYSTGGGATNAAVTFARQEFATNILAKIGDDVAGRETLKILRNEAIDTKFMVCDLKAKTGYSTLLLAPTGERTVLVYRGASEDLNSSDFNLAGLKADWLYITSLAGNLKLLERVCKIAIKNKIKIAIDPGSRELARAAKLKKLLPSITLVKGNREEMQKLFPGNKSEDIIKAACRQVQFAIVSDGAQGSWASDGTKIYRAGMYKDVKVVDRTGAGDAFGSGFVATVARGASIEAALTFASANSTSVVQYVGAKDGILRGGTKLKSMKISVSNT